MKIIEPYIEHWKQGDDVKAHVAKCARVCYGKETGNDDVTINTLLKKHHWSMFRHESVYVIGEFTSRLAIALERYSNNPYINWTFHNNKLYIATNGNFCLDLKERQEVNAHAQILLTYINYYRVSEDTFFNDEIGYNMMRYTFVLLLKLVLRENLIVLVLTILLNNLRDMFMKMILFVGLIGLKDIILFIIYMENILFIKTVKKIMI